MAKNGISGLNQSKYDYVTFAIIGAVALEGLIGLLGRYVLFADGSYMTLSIAKTQTYFLMPIEWNRAISYVISELGPVVGANFSHVNLSQIVFAYGITAIFLPGLLLILAIWHIRENKFSIIIGLIAVFGFGSSLLIGVSTSLIGTTLNFIFVAIIWNTYNEKKQLNMSTCLIFPLLALTGDAYILFVPTFILIVVFASRRRTNLKSRVTLLAGVFLGACINFANFLQRSQGVNVNRATNNALNVFALFSDRSLICLGLGTLFCAIAILMSYKMRISFGLSGIIFAILGILNGPSSGHEIFQARYLFPLALSCVVALAVIVDRFYNKEFNSTQLRYVWVPLVILPLLLFNQLQVSMKFNSMLSKLQKSTVGCQQPKNHSQIGLTYQEAEFSWDYTTPSLSRILWLDAHSCLVKNANPALWEPFTPSNVDPLGKPIYWKR